MKMMVDSSASSPVTLSDTSLRRPTMVTKPNEMPSSSSPDNLTSSRSSDNSNESLYARVTTKQLQPRQNGDGDAQATSRSCWSQNAAPASMQQLPELDNSTEDGRDIEPCGLLTINRHRFALEYDHGSTAKLPTVGQHKKPTLDPSKPDETTAPAIAKKTQTDAPPKTPVVVKVNTLKVSKKAKRRRLSSRRNATPDAARADARPERQPDTVSICTAHSRYEIISVVARQMGWRCSREQDASNVLWTDSIMGVDTCRVMRRFQKINHFPGMHEICRKDLLARNMNRMLKLYPKEYQIFPKTWHLPADYGDAVKFARQHRNRTYILKPDQGAQGRGISLTKSLKDVSPTEHIICQLYVNRPLLIDGFKFDLRVYALITCIDPLRVYVYNEGLARFATSPYHEPKGHNTTNMYMHLTNYSVNKHSRTYSKDDELGSKRKFSTLNRILSAEGYDVVTLWNSIDDVVIKTIVSAWPVLRHNYVASFPTHDIMHACFEILGVDVIIDQNLKPWLLEVNHSPSFHTDGPVDKEVKHALIRDTFTMLNIQAADKRRVVDEDKRRVNCRLMRKIKEYRGPTQATILEACDEQVCSKEPSHQSVPKCRSAQSPWLAQIAWEETHMGGFRRVLPVPGDPEKYTAFLDRESNCASVYSETMASKKREEEASKQRALIAEREKFPISVKMYQSTALVSEDELLAQKRKQNMGGGKRMRRVRPQLLDGYHMEPVTEAEERERVTQMTQRDFLVRSCGVLQYIYTGFYRNNLLSEVELRKYEDLKSSMMDSNFEVLHYERKLRMKSLATVASNVYNI